MMTPNKVFRAHEKRFEGIQKLDFALGKWEHVPEKSEIFPGRTGRCLNTFLKLSTLKSTKLKQQANITSSKSPSN